MCGVFGYVNRLRVFDEKSAKRSLSSIAHRGPDDQGEWKDEQHGVYLSQVRLSILDLSEAGHQPMQSHSGRYVITFNGEIYNHSKLKAELDLSSAIKWRGHSDTEVFLEAVDCWGIRNTLERVNGMFAFAIWDRVKGCISLGRDRMGEKPLYYGWQGNTFLFSSDLAAIEEHIDFEGEIDKDALSLFLQFSYIPAPWSIYKGLYKLEPGKILSLTPSQSNQPYIETYWSVPMVLDRPGESEFRGDDVVNDLEILLRDSVKQQMLADVSVGAFLSGGIDSSLIVALMQEFSPRPVKTFTIGFNSAAYNEAEHAKLVASHLGTDHTELYITAQQTLDVIPSLCKFYSEPFADSSQIPTILVSQLAKSQVTVALTGDAGDELFCGYRSYTKAKQFNKTLQKLPYWVRRVLYDGSGKLSFDALSREFSRKIDVVGKMVIAEPGIDVYQRMISRTRKSEKFVLGSQGEYNIADKILGVRRNMDYVEQLMAIDLQMYLPDNNLCKVDRAAMSVSLETRVPMLDHRVVEYALNLPISCKLRDGKSKWPLRQILYKYVPANLIERPKMGFSVPLADWLGGPLREWAEQLIQKNQLRAEGFFNVELVSKTWKDQLSGRRDNSHLLWNILMFQSWLQNRKEKKTNINE